MGVPSKATSTSCRRNWPLGPDPDLKAHVSTFREHKDYPSGGFAARMFAVRNGHEEISRALINLSISTT
jgi:hypothetical protein